MSFITLPALLAFLESRIFARRGGTNHVRQYVPPTPALQSSPCLLPSRSMRPRKTLVAALFALAISCLVWTLSQTEIGQIFEFKTLDYRFRLRPIEPVAPQLLVVAIDDQRSEEHTSE